MYNAWKTHCITSFLYVFLVKKVIKTSIVFINLGDQNLVNNFNKPEIIIKDENEVRAEK